MNREDLAVLTNFLKLKVCHECLKLTYCMRMQPRIKVTGEYFCTQCFSRLSEKDYILGVRILEPDSE
jgi:hypothetical protein